MSELQSAVGNGQHKSYLGMTPEQIGKLPVNEQLAALAESRDENERLRKELAAKEQPTGVALYEFIPANGSYKATLKLTLPGSKAIMGQRRKFVALIAEVESGRMGEWLKKHPELP